MKNYNKNNELQDVVKDDALVNEEVKETFPAKVETMDPKTRNGIIVGAMNVKVRRKPKLDEDNVVEILRQGDKVKILGETKEFYKVSTSVNRDVYIFKPFVKEE